LGRSHNGEPNVSNTNNLNLFTFSLFWVKEMVSVKERYEYAKRHNDLEFVAMIDLAVQHSLISMDDRWDVNEEEILNWWENFKEDLEKQGKTIRYFYGEKTWVITKIG